MAERTPLHEAEPLHEHEPVHRRFAGAALVAAFSAFMIVALVAIPREHAELPAIARYAMTSALPNWKITEPVNEVVYGTRGFDTFGETFLLLAAVVGTGTITRPREARRGFIGEEEAGRREQAEVDPSEGAGDTNKGGSDSGSGGGQGSGAGYESGEEEARKAEKGEQGEARRPRFPDFRPLGTPAPETAQAMSPVVRGAARLASPVLLVAGIYLAAWGYSPGGGFPAGAVILGVVLIAYVSLGYRTIERVVRPGIVEPIEVAGALLIVAVEVLGLVLKGSFSANFLPLAPQQMPLSGGILQWFSGSELIEVATGLTLAVFGLLGMDHDWSRDEADDGDEADEGDESDEADEGDEGAAENNGEERA